MSNTITKSQGAQTDSERVKNIKTQLVQWAHQGTWESLCKINDFIDKNKDKELKGFAETARDEASFFYYSPNSESEETDFLIAKMIQKREKYCDNLMRRIEAGKLEIDRLKIDKKITQKLFKTKKINDECVYKYCEDYAGLVAGRLEEFKEELEYENNWIEVAQTLIKNKKYLDIPYDVLDSFHLDGEDDSDWMYDFVESEEGRAR
jgi:hypothetical protein